MIPDPVQCFFITPTDRYRVSLRRYRGGAEGTCPGRYGYHNASVEIAIETHPTQPVATMDEISHDDSRWPTHCPCGYAFVPEDSWQVNHDNIYSGGGIECTLNDAPPGAMWDAYWWRDREPKPNPGTLYCGPDGLTLVVVLPTGEHFMPDAGARNGEAGKPGWTRTGTVPKISTLPSIQSDLWHGYLTDGVLKAC